MANAIERGLEKLRRKQAERVMPIVGALLDAWDNTPNDTRQALENEYPHLCGLIEDLREAAEGEH